METENNKKYTYKIIKESEDPSANRIEKSGITSEFSLAEIKRDMAENEKHARAWAAQVQIEKAKMENVEHHHPFVKELTPQQLSTVYFYQACKVMIDTLEPGIQKMEEANAEMIQEIEEIKQQIGIAIPMAAVADEPAIDTSL